MGDIAHHVQRWACARPLSAVATAFFYKTAVSHTGLISVVRGPIYCSYETSPPPHILEFTKKSRMKATTVRSGISMSEL
eukprot:COSAG01_NODE_762_length_13792_cov_19.126707_7_plen_79_part_00